MHGHMNVKFIDGNCENLLLRRMFQSEREEINDGVSYIRAFIICTLYHFIGG